MGDEPEGEMFMTDKWFFIAVAVIWASYPISTAVSSLAPEKYDPSRIYCQKGSNLITNNLGNNVIGYDGKAIPCQPTTK